MGDVPMQSMIFATAMAALSLSCTINAAITGKILSESNAPLSACTINLKKAGNSTTSSSTGEFTLSLGTGIHVNGQNRSDMEYDEPWVSKGILRFKYKADMKAVCIEVYNLCGKIIFSKRFEKLEEGLITFDLKGILPDRSLHSILLLRFINDKVSTILKLNGNGSYGYGTGNRSSKSNGLSKYAATINDTIQISKTGYQSINIPVKNDNLNLGTIVLIQNASYSLTTAISPQNSGTISKSPNQTSFLRNSLVTITAVPSGGYVFKQWSGDTISTSNPVTIKMMSNKTITGIFTQVPVISVPANVTADFQLSVTYTWPVIASSQEYYEIQASISPDTGFGLLHKSSTGTRISPYTISVLIDNTVQTGSYYFRARVNTAAGLTPWSTLVAVFYTAPGIQQATLLPAADNTLIKDSYDYTYEITPKPTGSLQVGNLFLAGTFASTYGLFSCVLKFNLPTAVTGKTIIRAILVLTPICLAAEPWATKYTVVALASVWNTSTINFSNCPNFYTSPKIYFSPPLNNTPVYIDVSNIVKNWVSGNWVNNGFLILDENQDGYGTTSVRNTDFASVDYYYTTEQMPTLYLEFQ
jgi:hypothetical protein